MPQLSPSTPRHRAAPSPVDLCAVVVAANCDEPLVLTLGASSNGAGTRLPSGPLASVHKTLEAGLRAWVAEQTRLTLGYVEQLYTFGDTGRIAGPAGGSAHALSIAYLALVREGRPAGAAAASWRSWYAYFPWEDWRDGEPTAMPTLASGLKAWVDGGDRALAPARRDRIELAFGFSAGHRNDESVLERYELLFEAGLVPEAPASSHAAPGEAMMHDHRRILATAIGRLRGKIKYRPVIFELMPAAFTLLDLQRTVEALAGTRLHKQNFRRLVATEGLVEETGQVTDDTGGRPARLVRFRREVLVERPAPGLRLPQSRRSAARQTTD